MATINLALNVQIAGGPQIQISKLKAVEAYDKIEVPIKPDGKEQSIEIQPGDANQVSFLMIKSSVYGSDLTYKVNDGGSQNSANPIVLDEPHLYMGTGAISVLGIAPKVLKFIYKPPTPDPDKKQPDAEIEILVGRDATPTPSTPPTN